MKRSSPKVFYFFKLVQDNYSKFQWSTLCAFPIDQSFKLSFLLLIMNQVWSSQVIAQGFLSNSLRNQIQTQNFKIDHKREPCRYRIHKDRSENWGGAYPKLTLSIRQKLGLLRPIQYQGFASYKQQFKDCADSCKWVSSILNMWLSDETTNTDLSPKFKISEFQICFLL